MKGALVTSTGLLADVDEGVSKLRNKLLINNLLLLQNVHKVRLLSVVGKENERLR